MIDITQHELTLVQEILREKLPAAKIWVFGSRAKGATRRGSDLDLAIDNGAALASSAKAHLAAAFEEAPLAYKIDIVDLHNISPEFRALINAHKIALPGFD